MIRTINLAKFPEYAEQTAKMLFSFFGREDVFTLDFFRAAVLCKTAPDGLPATFVALDGDVPVGAVCLWRSDLLSRQDLCPWLANLFVKEDFRGNHIGAALQAALLEYANAHGFEKVYLYTDLVNYYEKTGWVQSDFGRELDGKPKRVYYKNANSLDK